MPLPLRRLLPAFALVAIILGYAASASPAVSQSARLRPAHPAAKVDRARPKRHPARPNRHRARPRRHRVRHVTLGDRAARLALHAVGVPYRWGGSSPSSGFDCSGLVYWTYGRLGIAVPHSSYALYGRGRRVALSHLKRGDLLFFYGLGHVGIYIGHGRMVHAPRPGRNVEVVQLRRSYYGRALVGARRLMHG
jgi:cell wall-associated NlpC family hydrolase